MARTAQLRAHAQSFDHFAADYDRLGELGNNDRIVRWLADVLPESGQRALDIGCGAGRHAVLLAERFAQVDAIDSSGPMIALARAKRSRPNISYWQADLLDLDQRGRYNLVLSVLTLHHLPDLDAALRQVKSLLAPGGCAVVVDTYDIRPERPSLAWRIRLAAEAALPLRLRLHVLALLRLGINLTRRRPATAWQFYRLSVKRAWLDHMVSDQPFSRDELLRRGQDLFPGCRFDILGGPRGIGLVWVDSGA